jgi:hypothetical protein
MSVKQGSTVVMADFGKWAQFDFGVYYFTFPLHAANH